MKITVINGSPKGKYSITLQFTHYLAKHFPNIEFKIFHVGQTIKSLRKKKSPLFDEIIQAVRESDCVLWSYPVYTLLVPYQLVHFIDLIFEKKEQNAFKGKYASQLLTSLHFYDQAAYNYIHNISEDLGMKHIHGHYPEMEDLETPKGRKQLLDFGHELTNIIENKEEVSRKFEPNYKPSPHYNPLEILPGDEDKKRNDYKVVLITDCPDENTNLYKMIRTFQGFLPVQLKVINLSDYDFNGGCLGCFHCSFEGNCVYKDGFEALHREHILTADCVIYGGTIKHHWFTPMMKCYDDRLFYNGHRISSMGKAVGYIISGPLRHEANMREILEARSEVGKLYLVDIVTDEYGSEDQITGLLKAMADKTMRALEKKPLRPTNFYGVGGMKIFRDLIYTMRGIMREDHRFYKKHGLYDFPHKKRLKIWQMKLIGMLLKPKKMRKKAAILMKKEALKKFRNIIDKH